MSKSTETIKYKRGYYRPSRPLSMAEVFDGRLRIWGLHEWDGWQYFSNNYEDAIVMGFDPCHRILTTFLCCDPDCPHNDDDIGDHGVTVEVEAENGDPASVAFCYSRRENDPLPWSILEVIEKAFTVKLTCERFDVEERKQPDHIFPMQGKAVWFDLPESKPRS
jgi:hypothetical protein